MAAMRATPANGRSAKASVEAPWPPPFPAGAPGATSTRVSSPCPVASTIRTRQLPGTSGTKASQPLRSVRPFQ